MSEIREKYSSKLFVTLKQKLREYNENIEIEYLF